jgi:hypothetical protein
MLARLDVRNLLSAVLPAVLVMVFAATVEAQDKQDKKASPTRLELTGCVSVAPEANGQFSFVEANGGGTYRLSGKGLKKYAGQRVTIVSDSSNKGLQFRTGLWPSPNVAAQAGALDPAQESIARQPGGAASVPQPANELKVVRVRSAEGACE